MSSNPLGNLAIDYWYKALLVIGTCVLIASLSTEMKGVENCVVQLISLGGIFIGLGEWVNHPLQEVLVPRGKLTGYPRKNKAGGNALDTLGVILVIIGVVKIFC